MCLFKSRIRADNRRFFKTASESGACLRRREANSRAQQITRTIIDAEMSSYFARQTAVREIGLAGLNSLQSVELAVVGTGGVGSAAACFLASQGIGRLKLVDQDIVEESNLHRLLGVDQNDLHLPKAEALARKLNLRHPWTETEAIVETLRAGNSSDLLDQSDLVIDRTDNF